jgi:hypothetical protein
MKHEYFSRQDMENMFCAGLLNQKGVTTDSLSEQLKSAQDRIDKFIEEFITPIAIEQDQKPDFKKLAKDYATENYSGTQNSDYVMAVSSYSSSSMMWFIWNTYVIPRDKTISEQAKRIKELELKLKN